MEEASGTRLQSSIGPRVYHTPLTAARATLPSKDPSVADALAAILKILPLGDPAAAETPAASARSVGASYSSVNGRALLNSSPFVNRRAPSRSTKPGR